LEHGGGGMGFLTLRGAVAGAGLSGDCVAFWNRRGASSSSTYMMADGQYRVRRGNDLSKKYLLPVYLWSIVRGTKNEE
jgi:hypothetical protein